MSEPKFTPGPWVFGTKGDWTISSAAHSGSLMGNASYYPWVPENKADWHLIAAAPDLYRELETLCDELDHQIRARYAGMTNYPSVLSDMNLELILVDGAKAALAKARGEG